MHCSHLVPEMTWQVSSNPRYQVSPVPMGLIFRVGRKGLRSLPLPSRSEWGQGSSCQPQEVP